MAPASTAPLRLLERDRPEPVAGELLLRVAACGVCRTDLQLAEGRSLDIITQADTLDAFPARLGDHYDRYTAGTVMLETADRLVSEEKQPSLQQFRTGA